MLQLFLKEVILWLIQLPVLLYWTATFIILLKVLSKKNGENVKENLVKYMESVIQYDTPNADTILAIQEVEALKKNPNKKIYHSFDEILKELDEDE